jgi:phage/conjugal plasmid C-4 type zinc finger TraR family protein
MDIVDDAQRREQAFLRASLANARGTAPQGESRTTCAECGDPIPEARQKAVPGVRLCISCQMELEDE